MGISKRIFLYSLGIVSLVAVLIIAYFTLMLSHLYANRIEMDRLNSLKKIQAAQLTNSPDELQNALNTFDTSNSVIALSFPKSQAKISVSLVFNSFEIELKDQELIDFYAEVVNLSDKVTDMTEAESKKLFEDLATKGKKLIESKGSNQKWDNDDLFQFKQVGKEIDYSKIMEIDHKPVIHAINDQQFLVENKVADKTNTYMTYIGLSQTDEVNYLVLAGTLTPKMGALQSVIYQSLPMIISVIFVIILFATIVFSKILVTPLKKLSLKMEQMKAGKFEIITAPEERVKADEYQRLEHDLTMLYLALDEQKKSLEMQNIKQKTFLAASSHQLKTPVTAALLLVEGMIGEVGKYRDTKTYLPELKSKLVTMQKIVNEILLIDQQTKHHAEKQAVNLNQLVSSISKQSDTLLQKKNITLINQLQEFSQVETDPLYLDKIIENLFTNALKYTPENQQILISGNHQSLVIENRGIQIPSDYLTKIFEPFVRPTQNVSGHGLGLYLVAQYAQMLDLTVTLENNPTNYSVIATIKFC